MKGQLTFDGRTVDRVRMKVKGIPGKMDLEIDVPDEKKKPAGSTIYLDELGFDEGDRIEVLMQYTLKHKGIDFHPDTKAGVGIEPPAVGFEFQPDKSTFHVERVIRKAERQATWEADMAQDHA